MGIGTNALLEIRGLAKSFPGVKALQGVDFTVRRGEVHGLMGENGAGKSTLIKVLSGVYPRDGGIIRLDGVEIDPRSPKEVQGLGVSTVYQEVNLIPHRSVAENIILALQARQGSMNTLSRKRQEEIAEEFIKVLGIRTPGPEQAVMNLSGGNQQKVLLARWLATHPRFLILDEPTRGIDVGAKAEIEKLMHSLRDEGMAILFISSELEEVVRDSQRVIVLRDRIKAGELAGNQISQETIMHTIAGHERGA